MNPAAALRHLNLGQKTILALLGTALLPLLAVQWFSLAAFENGLRDEQLRKIAAIADAKADTIGNYVADKIRFLEAEAGTPMVIAHMRATHAAFHQGVDSVAYQRLDAQQRSIYRGMLASTGGYDWFFVDMAGNVTFTVLQESDFATNLFSGPFAGTELGRAVRRVYSHWDSTMSDTEFYPASGKAAAFVATPVMAEGGEPLGALVMQLDQDRFAEVAQASPALGRSSETVLARNSGGDGVRVLFPLLFAPEIDARTVLRFDEARAQDIQLALTSNGGNGEIRDYRGVPVLAAWRYLALPRMGMMVKVDLDEALAPARALRARLAWLTLAALLLVGVCGVFLGRRLAQPLRQLSRRVASLATASDVVPSPQGDELHQLSATFDAMATQLRIEQAALAKSHVQFETMFEANPLPMGITDLSTARIVRANAAVEQGFGWRPEEMVGHSAFELGIFENLDDRDRVVARAMNAGTAIVARDWRIVRRDGTSRLMHLTLRAVTLDDRPHLLWIARDVTDERAAAQAQLEVNETLERRVAERTRELDATVRDLSQTLDTLSAAQDGLARAEQMAALGGLVAGIAHELNTPLGNARTTMETLSAEFAALRQEIADGTVRRRRLDDFLDRGTRMGELILRSLIRAAELVASFKRVAVDQTSEQRREFDLATVVADCVEALRPSHKHSGIAFAVEATPGVMCDGYPGQLGQIVTNLVQNAAVHAFVGEGEGAAPADAHIAVSAEPLPASGEIRIVVADNGRGIPAAVRPHIFERFFTTRRGKGGSGLGLHIVESLARELGGHIELASREGAGTRFIVTLPRTAPARD